jgi:hypothetical protein
MKYIAALILCVFISSCSEQTPPSVAIQDNEAIYVLIENGGTIPPEEQEGALDVVFHLLQQLTKMERRKATRNTQIHILLSALPNRLAWSGTPRQLLEQAQDIKDLITFKQTFSDLVMAFDQIETTINLTQPERVRLYWIGSTINVPFQLADNNTAIEVKVPQEVPANLALANFADRLSVLKIMRVHPDQDQKLQAYLASIGILSKAKSGDIDFALLGNAQTRSRIENLL